MEEAFEGEGSPRILGVRQVPPAFFLDRGIAELLRRTRQRREAFVQNLVMLFVATGLASLVKERALPRV